MSKVAEESGLNGFPRLRFSRGGGPDNETGSQEQQLSLDFAANKSAATSADLSQYHCTLATHGLINSRHADLSGIVLSLVDQEGKPQNGFLRLYILYEAVSELVVLSACQTALGKDIREKVWWIDTRFHVRGAPRIVASLWGQRIVPLLC
jgi:CHAT domain-containing protein